MVQRSDTSAPVVEAVSALSWVNQVATVEDTKTHPLVQQVIAGAKGRLAHKTVKKERITPDILSKLVEKFGQAEAPLSDTRTLTMCLVGYAGFFRLSYTRVREVMLEMLEAIGLDKRQFGLHSLRAGGASAAANAGVVDRLFKRHGRWKSENAEDGYVKDTLQERLKVSRNLGLSD